MKRYANVLLGVTVVITMYFLFPEALMPQAKRLLEVMVVIDLTLEVLKKR